MYMYVYGNCMGFVGHVNLYDMHVTCYSVWFIVFK